MITPLQKRYLLFLLGCIPSRFLLTYISKIGSVNIKKILGVIAFVIATGFMYIYLTGSRKTGVETGGAPIWWNNIRPIHSLFYYTFAFMIYFKYYNDAWKVLFIDTIFGLFSFLYFHFS